MSPMCQWAKSERRFLKGLFPFGHRLRNDSCAFDEALDYRTHHSVLQRDERNRPRPSRQINQEQLQRKSLRIFVENRSRDWRDVVAGLQQIASKAERLSSEGDK